ncbi:MAG TPA: cellulase family glycosylhydrolase, partial [Verrucomicrobiae bacterium]|nr:cellulase family glycosylhydrolase [Verrucomicrobiae bacterium]
MKLKAAFGLLLVCLFEFVSLAQPAPRFLQLTSAQLWQRLEFGITNVPAATNPFDPDQIRLDATFTLPSGKMMTVPAFWYQGYQRGLSGGYEYLTAVGSPQWRLRFTPPESGTYSLSLAIQTNDHPYGVPWVTNFVVPVAVPAAQSGYVGIAPGRQYFQTGDGQALRLIGENVAWPTGGPGTYQYDTWFANLQAAGENYARLMCTPWSFSIENASNSLVNYQLDGAWKLDYVMQLAEQHGLYVLLCLDIHLMLQPVPDMWGNDNYWQSNPYNSANGGPCLNEDGFFTNATAQADYQKRLRYLVARYGYSPRLVAWQLLSEIDNEYAYLTWSNVPPWHSRMAGWLHTNDPYGHLVTTSLTGGSDRPDLWTVPQLDFATYHSYGDTPTAARIQSVAQSFLQRYGKPVLIDEFGTSAAGWNHTNDVYLRGWRQGLWAGALGGSAGTAMSWWWDSIDPENDYPVYSALGSILKRTGWGRGGWTNINFLTSGAPPATVGDPVPGGQPFNIVLTPGGVWGAACSGRLAVPDLSAAAYAPSTLNSFVLGSWFPGLAEPFVLSARLTNSASIVLHINSVSISAALAVLVDGVTVLSTNLPNQDGGLNQVDNSYNLDLPLNLPSGRHLITITNPAPGWVYLDWVKLNQVLPATYDANWQPSQAAIGLRGARESLIYVVSPFAAFPAGATNAALPLQHAQTVTMTNWPAGNFFAEWYDPATGTNISLSRASTTNGSLTLSLPDYSEDLAGIVYPPPTVAALGMMPPGTFQ